MGLPAEYLRGTSTTDNNECAVLFKEYSSCLHVSFPRAYEFGIGLMTGICLKGALKSRGIDKLLDEAREDNKENDATLMGKKKCK